MYFHGELRETEELAGADSAQSASRSLDELASMRGRADELILDIWNQVERKYAEVMPNEKRLELCRAYGLIYYYRTGEKEEIAK